MADGPAPKTTRSYRAHGHERRDGNLRIRLSAAEKAQIKALADARGVSMARLMKESTLSESYDRRDRDVMIAALDTAGRLLGNMAGNLNQLAHHANIAGQLVAHADLERALGQVHELRAEVSETLRNVR
jgi:hypothetical protein